MSDHWEHVVEAHRHDVRSTVMESAWALAQEHGPLSVTMSQIATVSGISRPTLYKYFPDMESILLAFHQRQVELHVADLADVLGAPGPALDQLADGLRKYGEICRARAQHGSRDVDKLVHSVFEMTSAENRVAALFAHAITRAADVGSVRRDISPEALAAYCVRALGAAADVPEAAVPGLVDLVVTTLRN